MSKLAVLLVLVTILAGGILLAVKGAHDINRADDRGVTAIQNSSP